MKQFCQERLIEGLAKGDTACLREIYNRYHQPLYAIAIHYLNDRALAEDAVQDVFIKLWDYREKLGTTGSLKSFLCTSLKNHVLNMIRDDKTRQRNYSGYMHFKSTRSPKTDFELVYKEYTALLRRPLPNLPTAAGKYLN